MRFLTWLVKRLRATMQFIRHPIAWGRNWRQEWPDRRHRIIYSWRDLKVVTPEIIRQGEERARAWDRAGRRVLLAAAVAFGALAICLAIFPIVSTHHHHRAYAVAGVAAYAAMLLTLRIISSRMDISVPASE